MSQDRLFSEDEFPVPHESHLSKLERAEQKEAMRKWFFQHYGDPVDETPYIGSEGGYQYIWGGPYDAQQELAGEFEGVVPEDVIEELADELNDISTEWSGNPDEYALDEYEFEMAQSTEHRASFDEAITIVEAILSTAFHEDLSQPLWRQQYAAVFSALEAYLSDFFYSNIKADETLFNKFVKVNKDFQKTKLSLSDIVEENKKLQQTVREYLAGLSWHNLPRIEPFYELVLGVKLNEPFFTKLNRAVLTRHDIVHRNGKKIDGTEIVLSREQIFELISWVRGFVQSIEEAWQKQKAQENEPEPEF
jgi:hypothetical protein